MKYPRVITVESSSDFALDWPISPGRVVLAAQAPSAASSRSPDACCHACR